MRFCSAALLVLGGLATTADAQVYTGYYHAPPYGTYANYAPGGFNGPLRVADWRWWAGVAPYSPAYAYPGGYGAAYSTGYRPVSYTAGYAPSTYMAGYATTSYFTPSYDSAIAYYPSPLVGAGNACCSPCGGATFQGTSNCPGGNCGMNYQPTPADGPQPDPAMGGVSGSKKFEGQSDPAPGAGVNPTETDPMNEGAGADPAVPNDNWRESGRFERSETGSDPAAPAAGAPLDGFDEIERKSKFGPSPSIEKKAPQPELPGTEAAPEEAPKAETGQPEASIFFRPIPEPEAVLPLVNRDGRISDAPSVLPERRRLSARFGSPELARSQANPEAIPDARDLKLVRK